MLLRTDRKKFNLLFSLIILSMYPSVYSQDKKREKHLDKPDDLISEETLKNPKVDVTKNIVSAYGLIQFNANLLDSTRSNTPDYEANRLRFGMKVQGGIAEGRLEVQFNGNNVDGKSGLTAIRRADLSLELIRYKYNQTEFITKFIIGGIRVGGAMSTAPDISYIPNKFGRQDGFLIEESIQFKEGSQINVSLANFNNIRGIRQQSVSSGNANWLGSKGASLNSNWGKDSFSKSSGYFAKMDATYKINKTKKLNIIAMHGFQDDAPSAQDANGNLTTANDIKHTEASLWYNDSDLFGDKGLLSDNGIAIWYENEQIGKNKKAIGTGGGQFNYDDGSLIYDDSQNFQLYGISASGDTLRYLTNMIQKSDRLTYAISYSLADVQFGNKVTLKGDENPNYKINQVAGYLGYAVNTFETGFNIAYNLSDQKLFKDNNGNINKNNALMGYLTAFYKF